MSGDRGRGPPPLSDRCANVKRPMMATSSVEKCNSRRVGSLAGRAKVINGGVGGGNPPLARLMLSYVTVTEQGFCVSWVSHIRAYARDLRLSTKETLTRVSRELVMFHMLELLQLGPGDMGNCPVRNASSKTTTSWHHNILGSDCSSHSLSEWLEGCKSKAVVQARDG